MFMAKMSPKTVVASPKETCIGNEQLRVHQRALVSNTSDSGALGGVCNNVQRITQNLASIGLERPIRKTFVPRYSCSHFQAGGVNR